MAIDTPPCKEVRTVREGFTLHIDAEVLNTKVTGQAGGIPFIQKFNAGLLIDYFQLLLCLVKKQVDIPVVMCSVASIFQDKIEVLVLGGFPTGEKIVS